MNMILVGWNGGILEGTERQVGAQMGGWSSFSSFALLCSYPHNWASAQRTTSFHGIARLPKEGVDFVFLYRHLTLTSKW